MNEARRKSLADAITSLESAKSVIEEIKGEEEESLENLPDSMKEGQRGTDMQEAIDNLDEAINSIESAVDNVNSATGSG